MKKMVIRYGLYSAVVMLGVFLFTFFFIGKESEMGFKISEIIGYATILLSMVFVFFGIKKHRDENNKGAITFWEALLTGTLIAAIPALAFGLYNLFYIEVLDPEFLDKYYNYRLEEAQATMSQNDFEMEKSKMESEKEMFQSPATQFFVMFLTVFIIGFLVSLISSIILKRDSPDGRQILESAG